jgi:hypothetical protein
LKCSAIQAKQCNDAFLKWNVSIKRRTYDSTEVGQSGQTLSAVLLEPNLSVDLADNLQRAPPRCFDPDPIDPSPGFES